MYAHPDFTFRHDIITVLASILKATITTNIELEFDVQPEKLNVAVGATKIVERVLMLRSTPTHSEKIQQILTQLFTEDENTDVHTLKKYMFVPMTIVGDDDRTTLQGVVRTQQLFRQNVHHYIVTNKWDITKVFQVPALETFEEAVLEDSNADLTHNNNTQGSMAQDNMKNNDLDDATKDVDMDANKFQDQGDEVDDSPHTEPYSLREWFYDLTDVDGEALIHAIYPSADPNKVFVLCEKQRAVKTLQVLHNLVDLVSLEFPSEALTVYFGKKNKIL